MILSLSFTYWSLASHPLNVNYNDSLSLSLSLSLFHLLVPRLTPTLNVNYYNDK